MTSPEKSEIFAAGSHAEQDIRQPYRQGLRDYLTTLHHSMVFPGHNPDMHRIIETQEEKAAQFMLSSDVAAGFVSMPQFKAITTKEKNELRGPCVVAINICIDGRLEPVLIGSPVFDISEAKAGLMPTRFSSFREGEIEVGSPRLKQAIIDRVQKEDWQLLQINAGHSDKGKLNCAAVDQLIELGILPAGSETLDMFKHLLEESGKAIENTFNRAATAYGKDVLPMVSLTAMYDTRTAGFYFEGPKSELFTTSLTNKLLHSNEMRTLLRFSQPDAYRHNFTDPATLLPREQNIYDIEKYLLRNSEIFRDSADTFINENYPDLTSEQRQAFRFMIAHVVSFQYATGLSHGGDTPISGHNEQYASYSKGVIRVGQYDPKIQSFGASLDSIDHFKTKIGLLKKLGKAKPPYIFYSCASQSEGKISYSTDRDTRAELDEGIQTLYKDPVIKEMVLNGELVIIPVVLFKSNGKIKGVPNLAI